MIRATLSTIADVFTLEPDVHGDARGFFLESYNARDFAAAVGSTPTFVQDTHSHSARGVLRGLHYQIERPQSKLVRVVRGEIFDVAVDLRRSSPTFGRWTGIHLSAGNKLVQWVPAGCAHGFLVISDFADVLYKATEYWSPPLERIICWDDPDLAISWPLTSQPLLSDKDTKAKRFAEAELYA